MGKMDYLIDYNPLALALNKIAAHSSLFSSTTQYLADLFFSKASPTVQKFFTVAGVSALSLVAAMKVYQTIKMWQWLPSHYGNQNKLSE